jgi:two-component system, LuxR family, sensor kinase FixL
VIQSILSDIVNDDSRAGEVIRRLRALLRKGDSQFRQLDLNALIRNVAKLLSTDAMIRNVAVTLELDPKLTPVRGDGIQLQQVVLNLLLNAMEAMSEGIVHGRTLTVRGEHTATETVHVLVQDAGTGLRQETLRQVFQPFYTTKSSGMRMGLAIPQSIIEAHGGLIWVTNNPTAGATFHFSLPIADMKSA